jgi:hypothetical protein
MANLAICLSVSADGSWELSGQKYICVCVADESKSTLSLHNQSRQVIWEMSLFVPIFRVSTIEPLYNV